MIGPKYASKPRRRKSIGKLSKMQVEQVREAVYVRDERTCVAASGECWGGLTIQHAIGRQMGGSALLDDPTLLRAMCAWHNTLAETDAGFKALCLRNGWALERRHQDVADEIPVRYPDGRWYRLIGTSRALLMPDEAAELLALHGIEE